MRIDPKATCVKVVDYLNQMLAAHDDDELMKKLKMRPSDVFKWPLIMSEVREFTELNAFINVFLVNPQSQFADRIQITLKKR